MKKLIKLTIYSFLAALAFSCSESDTLIDQVFDTVDSESGVILRTIEEPQDLVTTTNETNNFIALTVEIQEGNGSEYPNFKEVRAYVQLWADQDLTIPVLDSNDNQTPEELITTYLPADFEIGENNLPRISIVLPTADILVQFPDAQIPVPAFIALRFEVEMNDGRVFTNENIGASVTGGTYFDSRFLYKIIFLNT